MKKETFEKVIVAVDFSDADSSVVAYARYLKKHLPIEEMEFVHVVPTFDFLKTLSLTGNEDLKDIWFLDEQMETTLKEKVETVLNEGQGEGVTYKVVEGEPLAELLQLAEEKSADLVVIGQKAGRLEEHGILARNLARKTHDKALIIPENAAANVQKVVVPIDFSENSSRALKAAIAFGTALNPDVEIIALNVFEVPSLSTYRLNRSREDFRKIIEDNIKGAFEKFFEKYLPDSADRVQRAILELELPSVGHYVVQFAREVKADLIVMGAKGHSTVERLLIGSVTERVLSYNEQIPTLIVR